MLVPTLGDAHQHPTVTARVLTWHKTDPGSEMTAVLELGPVADCSHDRRGGLRSDAFDRRDALAGLALAEHPIDLPVERDYPAVQVSEEIVEFVDRLTRLNNGRAFYASPEALGEYVLVDYVDRKRKRG